MYGVWERTGWNSLGGTVNFLIFDAPTGTLKAIGRARSSLLFSDDFDHFQGKMFVESLPCPSGPPSCPDPLDPAAKWVAQPGMPSDGISVSGTRLERVAAAPLPQ